MKGRSVNEKRTGVAGSGEQETGIRKEGHLSKENSHCFPEVHMAAGRGRSFPFKLWPEGQRELGQE